ncbi:MAG: histidine kinase [Blastocatellia bacterium]|nr:histidine kinase [Blastocatellia bacterium]
MRHFIIASVLVCAFLCSAASRKVTALNPGKAVREYICDSWQTDEGLPQNYVQSIVQTRDGYIWLATQEGLVRFDGVSFTVFDRRNTEQLKENNIQTLYEDRQGALWIGAEGGAVTRLKDGTFTAFTTADGLADDIVDAIYEDRAGSLWIGTLNGLSRLKDGTFTTYSTQEGLADNTILAICEDRSGKLWVGTENGLSSLENDRFTTYTAKDGLAGNIVRTICEDRDGNLWIGTLDGLSRLSGGRFTTYTVKDGLTSNNIMTVSEDRDGNLWIGTRTGGLVRFRDGRFSPYTTGDGLSNDGVAAVHEDREGNIWIGTYGGGLNRLKDGKFVTFTVENGLSNNLAQSIYEDRKGNIWIGTYGGGLNRLKDGKFTAYTKKNGLSDNIVLSLHEDHAGNLWVGTNDGLNRLRGESVTVYTSDDGLSDNTVLAIREDRDKNLWVGTAGGLNRFDGRSFTAYGVEDGLTNDIVWALAEDRNGNLWIGTDGGGLNRFKDGRIDALTTDDGLVNDIVMSLYEDSEGSLWIGTSGGLSRLKDGKLNSYTSRDGLFDDVVFQILEDEGENLWMSCNKGVFRVSKKELEDFSRGKIASIRSTAYGIADGMKNRECNGGVQPAGWKSRDGRLWFPTIEGVAVIDPQNIVLNDVIPPVVIEEFIVDGKKSDLRGAIELEPGMEKFEFKYTGLSYTAPDKVRFQYMLEGFDNEWVDAGAKREASYTNIPPGRYRFKVKAGNNDGLWNESGAAMEFYLKPRFHETYWFYLLCAVSAGLVIWAVYRIRIRQIQSRFQAVLVERNRIAREIHDTLAQGFVGIGLQLEALKAKLADEGYYSILPAEAERHLDLASSMVAHSLAEARRTVWNLRSQTLEDGDLAAALSSVGKHISEGTAVKVRIKTSGAVIRLSEDVENNLLRIGQEAMTNSIRHARPQSILAELVFGDECLTLRVRDDGCGFDVEDSFTSGRKHFGLISMRERTEQIGGRFTLRSEPGRGTEIEVTVPVGR